MCLYTYKEIHKPGGSEVPDQNSLWICTNFERRALSLRGSAQLWARTRASVFIHMSPYVYKETYIYGKRHKITHKTHGHSILHKHGELIFFINMCVSLWEWPRPWERTGKRQYNYIFFDILMLYVYRKTYICAKRPTHNDRTHGHASVCVCFKTNRALSAEEAHNSERTCERVSRVSHVNESCLWREWMISPCEWVMSHSASRCITGLLCGGAGLFLISSNFQIGHLVKHIGRHTVIHQTCTHTCRHFITPPQGA